MHQGGPILDIVRVNRAKGAATSKYPFSLEIIQNLTELVFPTQVTFFVGENGTGKSTILEAIASRVGFGKEGGSQNINFSTTKASLGTQTDKLAAAMILSWRKKPKDGYFFRAESFFNLATHIDTIDGGVESYGGISLHAQSHGESFLSFFNNRLGGGGFYILDEPEAALSPQRQLALLRVIHDVCKNPESQFLIATHSPIILAYPEATIYSCDGPSLKSISYNNTSHYEITKGFLDNPKKYLSHLFSD